MRPTLKLGSHGQDVTDAKIAFNRWNAKKGNTTGVFGPFFRSNIKRFQTEHRIPASGWIGPVTWAALAPFLPKPPKPKPPAVPALGPVRRGGQTVLDHDCTHATDGIPLYPAFDDCFGQGVEVLAPEALHVTRQSSSRPGQAFYATGTSGIKWWFGHLTYSPPVGRTYAKGAVVGRTAPNYVGGGPHVHVGVNVENLWGKGQQLAHKTSYQHGAPRIGVQLRTHGLL